MKKGFFQELAESLAGLHQAYDLFTIAAGALISFLLRYGHMEFSPKFQVVMLLGLLLAFIVFPALNVYRPWRGQPVRLELETLAAALLIVLLALLGLAFLTKTGAEFSRAWLIFWFAITFVLIAVQRVALRAYLRLLRRSGRNKRQALIVGAGRLGTDVAFRLGQAQWSGIEVVAFLDDNRELHGRRIDGVPVYGSIDKLPAMCQGEYTRHSEGIDHIDQVWIALPFSAQGRVQEVLAILDKTAVQVHYIPDLFGFHMLNHSVEEFAGIPIINLSASPLIGANAVLKEIGDRLFAALALIMLSPFMLLIAIGIKVSSAGPVLYRQERVSWNGRRFVMLKFRTMPTGVETKSGPVWAKPDERRATHFGAFLRKTSLDELPQFINVLKGEMSVVGPRPERPHFVDAFKEKIPGYMKKHLVKAGITGWAQVNGWRGDTSLEKRVEHDLYYIQNWSLWLDAKIIMRTLFGGMFGKNAY
jgi:putative colanic acid biosynthesis UDP-glucose lipid carrier transferase